MFSDLFSFRENVDEMTGFLLKPAFYTAAQRLLLSSGDEEYLLMQFEIKGLKEFISLYGDELYRNLINEIAYSMRAKEQPKVLMGRIELDSFAAVLPAKLLNIEQYCNEVDGLLLKYNKELRLNADFGIYEITDKNESVELMSDMGRLAIKSINNSYKTTYAFYKPEMLMQLRKEQQILSDCERGILRNEFVLYFQPQVNFSTGELVGAEALVRWQHPGLGLLTPGNFIPVFERTGFIKQLDMYVLENLCKMMHEWCVDDDCSCVVPISFNLSRLSLLEDGLVDKMLKIIDEYNIPHHCIHVEITESAYIGDPKRMAEFIAALHRAGLIVIMDDFGSGYSSLNTLKDLEIDILKLDSAFLIQNINNDNYRASWDMSIAANPKQDAAIYKEMLDNDDDNLHEAKNSRLGIILSSIIRMTRWLRIPLIAEGVEFREQADYLRYLGCHFMQGYYFAHPMPQEDFLKWLHAFKNGNLSDMFEDATTGGITRLWSSDNQLAYLFNDFVGAAMIAEYSNDVIECARINDRFFKEIVTTRVDFAAHALNLLNAIHKDEREIVKEAFNLVDKSYPERVFYCRMIHNGMENVVYAFCHIRFLAETTDRKLVYVHIENITAQQVLREEVKRHHAELVGLMEDMPCGLLRYNITNGFERLDYANETLLNMLGYSRRSFFERFGLDHMALVIDEEREAVFESIHAQLLTSNRYEVECRLKTRNGGSFYVFQGGTIAVDERGECWRYVVIVDFERYHRGEQLKQFGSFGKAVASLYDKIWLINATEASASLLVGSDKDESNVVYPVVELFMRLKRNILKKDERPLMRLCASATIRQAFIDRSTPSYIFEQNVEGGRICSSATLIPLAPDCALFCIRNLQDELYFARQESENAVRQLYDNTGNAYKTLFSNIGIPMMEFYNETADVYFTPAFAKYKMSELQKNEYRDIKKVCACIHPDDVEAWAAARTSVVLGEPFVVINARMLLKNGSYMMARQCFTRVNNAAMHAISYSYLLIELGIDEKKDDKPIKQICEVDNPFKNLPVAVCNVTIGLDGMVKRCVMSDLAKEILGMDDEDISKTRVCEFLTNASQIRMGGSGWANLIDGKTVEVTATVKRNGRLVPIILKAKLIVEKDGALTYNLHIEDGEEKQAFRREGAMLANNNLVLNIGSQYTLFNYDVNTDSMTLEHYRTDEKKKSITIQKYLHNYPYGSFIAPESVSDVRLALRLACNRPTNAVTDFICGENAAMYAWCRAFYISVEDSSGNITNVRGRINVIQDEKDLEKRHNELLAYAQLDGMTGLYNKSAGIELMQSNISKCGFGDAYAMYVMDVDDFKNINDTAGHLSGDKVLRMTAEAIMSQFRDVDVVCRFGGDEFVALVTKIGAEAALAKGENILKAVRNIAFDDGTAISVSIGVSHSSQALGFGIAFDSADKALYIAKSEGKDCVRIITI